jgi:molecular chaperone GrpE
MKRQKNVTANDSSNGTDAHTDGPGNGAAPEGVPPGAPAPEAAAAPAPELPAATPEEKLASLVAERDEVKDRMLRIAADFENFKRRARKEQTDAVGMQAPGNGAVDGAAVLKGVDLVLRLLKQKLERHEVRPFDAAGQPFDPRVHEAISRVEHPEIPAGSVAAELQKGYRVGERLLRPAMVAVSSGAKPTTPSSEG